MTQLSLRLKSNKVFEISKNIFCVLDEILFLQQCSPFAPTFKSKKAFSMTIKIIVNRLKIHEKSVIPRKMKKGEVFAKDL